ncbi:helix-turn-helix domain-containing protein [Candidatus Roizmanbacteria bacterium]|nr:MAG: helix-turn-helix domain-containing protein [Candidatus Roizmanbacteria bacterium]
MTFAEKYGIQAAVDAYGISRRTLFRWRKRRRDSEGQLDSLIPETTKPKTPDVWRLTEGHILYQRDSRTILLFGKGEDQALT